MCEVLFFCTDVSFYLIKLTICTKRSDASVQVKNSRLIKLRENHLINFTSKY